MLAGPRDTEGCSTAAGQFVPQTIMEHDGKDTEAALITGPRRMANPGSDPCLDSLNRAVSQSGSVAAIPACFVPH